MSAQDKDKSTSELILFRTEDARTRIQVRLEEGTVWLTQAQMAELYEVTVKTVSEHRQRREVSPNELSGNSGQFKPKASARSGVKSSTTTWKPSWRSVIGSAPPAVRSSGNGRRHSCPSTWSRASSWTMPV